MIFIISFLSCITLLLGITQTFVAPNGEYITATLKGEGYLHLTGNLNLAPSAVEASILVGPSHWRFYQLAYFDVLHPSGSLFVS